MARFWLVVGALFLSVTGIGSGIGYFAADLSGSDPATWAVVAGIVFLLSIGALIWYTLNAVFHEGDTE